MRIPTGRSLRITVTLLCVAGCSGARADRAPADSATLAKAADDSAHVLESRHLSDIRQLTHGSANAESYFSHDGQRLIFQSTRDGRKCDQQYTMRLDGSDLKRVSNGQGKTTCGYYMDGDRRIFYASTHAADTTCPPRPDPSKGYVWGLDPFDIYVANADGSALKRLTNYGVYTAEGTLSPDGKRIVFTSLKDGDLELYTMNIDGTNIKRLTNTPGYDGGAFFSPDGKQIVYRAWHPTDTALTTYQGLLKQRLVRPNRMELWIMNADGTNQHQITQLGGPRVPTLADDSHHSFLQLAGTLPVTQKLADEGVELFRGRMAGHGCISINPSQGDFSQDRHGLGAIPALDEQHALGMRIQRMRPL